VEPREELREPSSELHKAATLVISEKDPAIDELRKQLAAALARTSAPAPPPQMPLAWPLSPLLSPAIPPRSSVQSFLAGLLPVKDGQLSRVHMVLLFLAASVCNLCFCFCFYSRWLQSSSGFQRLDDDAEAAGGRAHASYTRPSVASCRRSAALETSLSVVSKNLKGSVSPSSSGSDKSSRRRSSKRSPRSPRSPHVVACDQSSSAAVFSGEVMRRASIFGSVGARRGSGCARAGAYGTSSESGVDAVSVAMRLPSPPLDIPAQQPEPRPDTTLPTNEIYRAQYRDLFEAESAVAQSERGENEDELAAAPGTPPAVDKSPAPASDRNSHVSFRAHEEQLERFVRTLLPGDASHRQPPPWHQGSRPESQRSKRLSGQRSDRDPRTRRAERTDPRIRLPPLPKHSDTARSGSTSSQPQCSTAAFASPSWTPNVSDRHRSAGRERSWRPLSSLPEHELDYDVNVAYNA